jgi:hypothetical protein
MPLLHLPRRPLDPFNFLRLEVGSRDGGEGEDVMQRNWPEGFVEVADAWKMSPEALAWGYWIYRATIDHDFPLVPTAAGWSQVEEFEYRKRAWAQSSEGRVYFAACRELAESVRKDVGLDLYKIVKSVRAQDLPAICGTCDRLITVPNPKYELAILGTDPPDLIEFSARILVEEPLRFLALYWAQWLVGMLCLHEGFERVQKDPVKESLVMLHLQEGTEGELWKHHERVRSHLLRGAGQVQGADVVAEDVLSTYLYDKELPGERGRGPASFQNALLRGEVASVHGYVCDLKSALAKWHRRTDRLDCVEELTADGLRERPEDEMKLEEVGALLDRNRPALRMRYGERGVRIIDRIYEDPDLSFEEIADLEGTSLSSVERDLRNRRERHGILNRRFETSWRPRVRNLKG